MALLNCLFIIKKIKMRLKSKFNFLNAILAMVLMLGSFSAFAQTQKLSGKITTKAGVGISGAIVRVKESNFRTTTDDAGVFSVQATTGSTLVVSSFGFVTVEKKVTGDNIVVTLNDDPTLLADVIVTA
jgi:hypothetical protein